MFDPWDEPAPASADRITATVSLSGADREDAIAFLAGAGRTDLAEHLVGPGSHSPVFDGQSGTRHDALADTSLFGAVSGAAERHVNAERPGALDDDLYGGRDAAIFDASVPPRASGQDPIVAGLDPGLGSPAFALAAPDPATAPDTPVAIAGLAVSAAVAGRMRVRAPAVGRRRELVRPFRARQAQGLGGGGADRGPPGPAGCPRPAADFRGGRARGSSHPPPCRSRRGRG